MKIALYTRVFPPAIGGMERFAEVHAVWLACRGHDVTVVTRTPASRDDGAFPCRVLRDPGAGDLLRTLRAADVVHVNGLSLRGIAAARAAGKRPVVTHAGHQAFCPTGLGWSPHGRCAAGPSNGPCPNCPGHSLTGWAGVQAHAFAAGRVCNVFVSRYLRDRVGLDEADVVYNPCRIPDTLRAGPEEAGTVAFAGRLVMEKGLGLLLRALTRLPDVTLKVAGDGPLRASLEAMARSLAVHDRVDFLGALAPPALEELFARAAVVCVPTVSPEAFGYVTAEAMACGRPVVGTPTGATVELLEEGRGFLARDVTAGALAETLMEALSDSGQRAAIGERALRFAASCFSVESVGPAYEAIYERSGA